MERLNHFFVLLISIVTFVAKNITYMKIQLFLSKIKNKDGLSEILLKIQPYVNGKTVSLRAKSGITINKKYFDKEKGIVSLSRKYLATPEVLYHREEATKLNELILYIEEMYGKVEKSIMTKDWLAHVVYEYYHPGKTFGFSAKKKSFYELAEEYKNKKQLSEGYKRSFSVMVRDVARFEGFVRATNPSRKNYIFDVYTIKRNEIEEFREYLQAESELSKEYPSLFEKLLNEYPEELSPSQHTIEPRGHNTIYAISKKLRSFFYWLNENGVTDNRPFDGIKLGSERLGTPVYITINERDTIANAYMPTKHLETQRDIFIFQCLIGCRVGDLVKLTEKNISNGILTYTPHKTRNEGTQSFTARVPLLDDTLSLIEKYKGKDREGRLFPFISPQQYNDAIKQIFTFAGITRNVEVRNPLTGEMELKPINTIASSHMARRTFVGNLYFQVQDPTLIGQMSGHAEGSKAFSRYRKIEDETLINAIKHLKKEEE